MFPTDEAAAGGEGAQGLRRGRFTYFPVVPGRLEFAGEVRQAIRRLRPEIVAVELPAALEDAYVSAVARLPQISVIMYPHPQQEEEAIYLPVEPADPFTEAIRTAVECGCRLLFADPGAGERPHLPEVYPDPYAVRYIGYQRYVAAWLGCPPPRGEEVAAHAAAIAWKLQGADPEAEIFVVVSLNLAGALMAAMETPQEEPRLVEPAPGVELVNPHPESLAEITLEYPYLQYCYEQRRRDPAGGSLDRRQVQLELMREAGAAYERNTGEKLVSWQRRLLGRYTRNLALTAGQLAAPLFDLVTAARAVVDDNFAWEVWQAANRYPPQQQEADIPTVRISGEEVFQNTRKLRLRRRFPRPKQRLRPASLKPRASERSPGEWARAISGDAICSYPPEDIVVEDFGRYLRRKAKSILSEERSRVEPFTTSLLDGIDLRETIRNWYEGKIFVREFQKIMGDVSSVVVIFDEDRQNRYPYLTTWLGEHDNESDMAFYSTYPFARMVGPGIGRAEYGGFLLSMPSRRMMDVWTDPDYEGAETKPERLLLAGLDYSTSRYVVYVAPRPPRSVFRTLAARIGRSILYVPLGQLAPDKLKKVRVLHVLDGHHRRAEAHKYIW